MRMDICQQCGLEFEMMPDEKKTTALYCPECKQEREQVDVKRVHEEEKIAAVDAKRQRGIFVPLSRARKPPASVTVGSPHRPNTRTPILGPLKPPPISPIGNKPTAPQPQHQPKR